MTQALVSPVTKLMESAGMSDEDKAVLRATFGPTLEAIEPLIAEAAALEVTDASQVGRMKKARELRLKLRQHRIAVENGRKALKEASLRRGQLIDKVAGAVKERIEPAEERMLAAEEFAERLEKARIDRVRVEREAEIKVLGGDPAVLADLGTMDDDVWAEVLDNARQVAARKLEEAARAEREREEREAAKAKERARLAIEREQAEVQARAEREARMAAEAEARAAREAQAKAEREAKEARDRELAAQRQREREEAARAEAEETARRKLAAAPDRDKVRAWAAGIWNVPHPDSQDPAVKAAMQSMSRRLQALLREFVIEADQFSSTVS